MDYRTLLVHVDSTAEGVSRLRNAAQLAQRLDAALIGVGAAEFNPMPDRTGMAGKYLKAWVDEELATAQAMFREATPDLREAVWRSEVRRPVQALADAACGADLIFASRAAEMDAPEAFARPDDLVLAAGAPVLVQPLDASPLDAERVIVGWKNTRESRRAIWDALPLLERATEVRVVRFVPELPAGAADDGLEDVVRRLQRHGVAAVADRRLRERRRVADDLLEAAEAAGAGLIVTGAYGSPRVREFILGGVTSGLLGSAKVHVLFSH